ncbi:MAG: hypothetical protein BWY64_03757 [bacterium ADurb.Bin363]|nr:MAG: hypothetical protein BWY64_03757 [bacterium ADurb.Bin363]
MPVAVFSPEGVLTLARTFPIPVLVASKSPKGVIDPMLPSILFINHSTRSGGISKDSPLELKP